MTPKKMPGAKPQKKRQSLTKQCDALFSKIVRSVGHCQINKVEGCPRGYLQTCHIFSRRYRGGGLRWDTRNAIAGCAGCHKFYTENPEAWDLWRREHLGDELFAEMQAQALAGEKVDLSEVLARLEELWAEVDA